MLKLWIIASAGLLTFDLDVNLFISIPPLISDSWKGDAPLWVVLANAGDAINVPGVTFPDKPVGGMQITICAHLIALNARMVPESLLSAFLHEYGHAEYRIAHPDSVDQIASEVAAIRRSLELLVKEGFPELAY